MQDTLSLGKQRPKGTASCITPATEKKARVRAYAPKVSSGCITCRIRRIKCGEEKPYCKRCTGTGRKCDGYSHTPKTTSSLAQPLPANCLDQPISVKILGSQRELRYFDIFRHRTATQFRGLCTSDFWDRHILQAAHHEPAIRHAVIAIGALHEATENDRNTEERFILEQYILATKSLVKGLGQGSKPRLDIALTTCVLFVCFELLRGHIGPALLHINSGVKILSEILSMPSDPTSRNPTSPALIPLKTLNLILSRLESQLQLTLGRPRLLYCPSMDDASISYSPNIPHTFTSLSSARNSLDYFWTTIAKHSAALTNDEDLHLLLPSFNQILQSLSCKLTQWSKALTRFLHMHAREIDTESQIAIHTLHIQKLIVSIYLRLDYERALYDEMIWDEFMPEYALILTHSTFIIESISNSSTTTTPNTPPSKNPSFSLDSMIIYPLCTVANRCRDSMLRRRALCLLERAPRQEGILPREITILISRRVLVLEGDGEGEVKKCGDVPNENRIAGMDLRFDGDGGRGVDVRFYRARGSVDVEWGWTEERFCW